MKTDNILEQILSSENLNEAFLQVKRNKGAEGVDGMKVGELGEYLKANGEVIKEQIRTRKYKPQPVKRVEIPKPDGGIRNLGVPTVTDRFIQQAIAQVLTPIYEEQFSDSSYGFRPGRCAEMAIIKCLEMMNDGYTWVIDIDLEKFFDNVNHDKLMNIVSKTVKDGDVISLIRKYLVSGVMIEDEYKETIIGTPQGGNLSPLLSNIMLNELDKELEERGLPFVRYADDCIILTKSEKAANRVMVSVTKFLEEKLGLRVNVSKSKVDRPNGIKYLGFGFYWDVFSHQFKAKPHQMSVNKLKEKLKQLTSRNWGVSTTHRVIKLKQLIVGWVNYFKIGQMKKMCRELDKHIRFRLRMCIWKQWKKVKTRYKNLRKLGLKHYEAIRWANTRLGYARVANSPILSTTISNERLKRFGLVSLLDQYQLVHV
ncbi:group II intron reverse transcriptase/maturase [Lacrimispora sp.]|uniref:group II intron reverse transcriptase/maturase n=1 Tax=Lacrimispora sp. TaxID=2719234 RepID=UPI00285773C3|nr:group II intron reverse transcriptase/maturase [Lacrimispora sp.]MDR7811137.1 group II intron reverse transcriptase/maturase [Lacrimispora sp.]